MTTRKIIGRDAKTGEVTEKEIPLTPAEIEAGRKPVTNDDINRERKRRTDAGLTVNITGIGSFNIQTRSQDRENIAGLSQMAGLRLSKAFPPGNITFRDADDVNRILNPEQVLEMGGQLAARIDAIYKASWAIKAENPIPQDYRDDARWP